ncbi:YwmB family TATA-box binding protein [Caldanaerobacter sp.]|uniref:YwmB family TATA-box binding protein n=1 Tax=Caldanaerobacter sp. TaxID=2930036 RepID=UPI003C741AF0
MKKIAVLIALIVGFILIFGMEMPILGASEVNKFYKAFKATGAKYEYANINGWGKLKKDFVEIKDMEDYLRVVSESLRIRDYSFRQVCDKDLRQVLFEYRDAERDVTVVVQSIKNDDRSETYLLIDEYLKNADNLAKEREAIEKAFQKVKTKPIIATSIVGSFKGDLSLEEKRGIVREVFKILKAKKVEGIEDIEVISLSGYIKNLGEYIAVGNEKINLQVALRYSSYEDKTYIWVATPLIGTEY